MFVLLKFLLHRFLSVQFYVFLLDAWFFEKNSTFYNQRSLLKENFIQGIYDYDFLSISCKLLPKSENCLWPLKPGKDIIIGVKFLTKSEKRIRSSNTQPTLS